MFSQETFCYKCFWDAQLGNKEHHVFKVQCQRHICLLMWCLHICQPCVNLHFFSFFSVDWFISNMFLQVYCTLVVVKSSKNPMAPRYARFCCICHQNSWLLFVPSYLTPSVARTCTNTTMEFWEKQTTKEHPSKIFWKLSDAPLTFSWSTVFNDYISTHIEEEEEEEESIMFLDTEENRLMISHQISISQMWYD